MTKIDFEAARSGKRKAKTRCGYPVRLVSNEGKEPFVLMGYITINGRGCGPFGWKTGGAHLIGIESDLDLIQEPEVIEFKRWANVYRGDACMFASMRGAEGHAYGHPIAIAVPVTTRIVGDKVEIFGGTEERKDDE